MILSFRDRRSRDFARGHRIKAFEGISRQAQMKLDRLDAATSIEDLAALPGDRRGQYSIRINDQWRLCFEWQRGTPGPSNVEIVDYH